MFYNIVYKSLSFDYSFLNVFKYITFRSLCAFLLSFSIILITGNKFIHFLKEHQKKGQPIREDGPASHLTTKKGTPTMGGILIILSTIVSTILFADLNNINIWLCLLVLMGFGLIGACDDYKKIKKYDYHGMTGRKKFLLQSVVAILCCFIYKNYCYFDEITWIFFPIFKNCYIDLGYFFVIWGIFVIVGSSNAVNLTDGLDGLAMGPVLISSICFAIICYLAGNVVFSNYLHIKYIPGISEICVFLGSLAGAGFGFMWFNAPPAKVFMGDTGSVAIGGVLGFIALISKQEFIYALIGGIFVIEALSVIIQVGYYKLTKKRIFLMAPLHHHFEKKGWSESTVVFRFWLISMILGILGLSLLKIR